LPPRYGSSSDPFDQHLGVLLAVAILHGISFPALLLKDRHLIPLHVLQDLPGNGYPVNGRRPDAGARVVADQQHPVEVHRLASLARQPGRVYILVLNHLKLLSGNIYDRVHSSFEKWTAKLEKDL